MRLVVLLILTALAIGSSVSSAVAMRPFDRCVSKCMERGCNQYNEEGQRCMLRRRGGCVDECRAKRQW